MALFPEREAPAPVKERPEEVSPLTIERKEVVSPVPVNFQKQVNDDVGQPLIQTPQNQVITIQIPSDPVQLESASKGDTGSAVTWLAAFWLRMIKKAVHFGWQIVKGRN